MSFYRPISRDYEYLGATLNNTRNSWGANTHDLTAIVLTGWADQFDEKEMTIPVMGGRLWERGKRGWKRPGYEERREHLRDIEENGKPFYVLVATDRNYEGEHSDISSPNYERKVDPCTPRRCFKGINIERLDSEFVIGHLGEEVDLTDLQGRFIHMQNRKVEEYKRENLVKAGVKVEPRISLDVVNNYERTYQTRDPDTPAQVYVIRQNGGGDHFKLGWSTDPLTRRASLQTGNPYELVLWAESQKMTALEAFAWEQSIHMALPGRMMGEWFDMKSIDRASTMVQSIYDGLLFDNETDDQSRAVAICN